MPDTNKYRFYLAGCLHVTFLHIASIFENVRSSNLDFP